MRAWEWNPYCIQEVINMVKISQRTWRALMRENHKVAWSQSNRVVVLRSSISAGAAVQFCLIGFLIGSKSISSQSKCCLYVILADLVFSVYECCRLCLIKKCFQCSLSLSFSNPNTCLHLARMQNMQSQWQRLTTDNTYFEGNLQNIKALSTKMTVALIISNTASCRDING